MNRGAELLRITAGAGNRWACGELKEEIAAEKTWVKHTNTLVKSRPRWVRLSVFASHFPHHR